MSSIFISHSSEDISKAELVKEALEEAEYRSIFLDSDVKSGIPPGQR